MPFRNLTKDFCYSIAKGCTGRNDLRKKDGAVSWLTNKNWDKMNYIYSLAKEQSSIVGEKYHVDHITPIRGKNICGLHVPWNLQVLPSDLNLKKGNL
jgi:hypothetical protein